MEEQLEYYILFPNVNEGLTLEKKLKESSIKYIIAPTPRELSKCCGISIKYNNADEAAIREIVEKHNINIIGFQSIKKRVFNNIFGVKAPDSIGGE